MRAVATRIGRWIPDSNKSRTFDFTNIFAAPEPGHKYSSGRRMWAAFTSLAPYLHDDGIISSTYNDYVEDRPYNASYPILPGKEHKLGVRDLIRVMRNYYKGLHLILYLRACPLFLTATLVFIVT